MNAPEFERHSINSMLLPYASFPSPLLPGTMALSSLSLGVPSPRHLLEDLGLFLGHGRHACLCADELHSGVGERQDREDPKRGQREEGSVRG